MKILRTDCVPFYSIQLLFDRKFGNAIHLNLRFGLEILNSDVSNLQKAVIYDVISLLIYFLFRIHLPIGCDARQFRPKILNNILQFLFTCVSFLKRKNVFLCILFFSSLCSYYFFGLSNLNDEIDSIYMILGRNFKKEQIG